MSGCSCSTASSAASPGPGPEDVHLAPLEGEAEADRFHDIGLVVDDQDPHQAGSGGPSAGTTRLNVLPRPGTLSTSMRAAMRLGDRECRGQPEADAFDRSMLVLAPDEEPLEQPRLIVRRDARTRIVTLQLTSPFGVERMRILDLVRRQART